MLHQGCTLVLVCLFTNTVTKAHVNTLSANDSYDNAVAYVTIAFVAFSYNFNIKSPLFLSAASYNSIQVILSLLLSHSLTFCSIDPWSSLSYPLYQARYLTLCSLFKTYPGIFERDTDILSNLASAP